MELTIVNADPKYSAVKLIKPTTLGYIHIAAEVHPRTLPFLPNGREKSEVITKLIINYAHWDESLPRFLWRQLSKKSFRNYMLANLAANRVGAIPVLYRLA